MHPILFHFGPFAMPTFGVLAALGLMAGLTLSLKTAGMAGVDPEAVWDAGLVAVVAAFVLSRVLLVVTNLRAFVQFPMLLVAVPSLTATGLLLTGLATLGWLRWKKLRVLRVVDAWAPCGALVWAFLALGHFAEGSDPGMATLLPWGVAMPGETTRLHPVGAYCAVAGVGLMVGLYRLLRRRATEDGVVAGVGLSVMGGMQFLISFVRQPGEGVWGLDALQWVAVGMMVVGGVVGFAKRWSR